jgi:hypothetical protein|nr:MAG TPA: Nuclease [Caudoviricetes sp.]
MCDTVLEKDIEKKLISQTKQRHGKAYKFVSPGNSGVPDRIVVLPGGKVGFCELKRPGGKTSKLQDVQIGKLKSLGCFVRVVDIYEGVSDFLDDLERQDLNADIHTT